MTKNDKVFEKPFQKEIDFTFDEKVAEVFEDMLERSVPQYSIVQKLMVDLTNKYIVEGTRVIDLGCSKGHFCRELAKSTQKNIEIIGVDASEPMIKQASLATSQELPEETRIKYLTHDILESGLINNACVTTLCLVLQFIRPVRRIDLLRDIYHGLNPGGLFIMYEKTVNEDGAINRQYIDLYHNFKKEKGYSDLEISQKRIALENVLIPFTNNENIVLLREAGFSKVVNFYQWLNFYGYLAVK